MATPEGVSTGDELIFVAHNHHHPRRGRPPRLRNADNPGLYHGYFEDRHGEQFVFNFDRATKAGIASGGDLGRDDPEGFTLALLREVLRGTLSSPRRPDGEGRGHLAASLPGGSYAREPTADRPRRMR